MRNRNRLSNKQQMFAMDKNTQKIVIYMHILYRANKISLCNAIDRVVQLSNTQRKCVVCVIECKKYEANKKCIIH